MEISEIKKYEKNAKAHPDWHIEKIANSIKAFGCKQPIVLDSKGEIIAGHGRFIAMTEKLGYTKLEAKSHTAKGEETIPYVLADDLSPKEVKALRLADNQLNAITGVDMAIVVEELHDLNDEGFDIELTGFDTDLLTDAEEDDADIDDITVNASGNKAKIKAGDIFELDGHKVMCGDCREDVNLKNLMGGVTASMVFTDPPYNIAYRGGMHGDGSQSKRKIIENDDMSAEDFRLFLEEVMINLMSVTKGAFYVCMSSSELHTLRNAFVNAGGHWQTYIIWAKNHFTLSRTDHQQQHEPILYGLSYEVEACEDADSMPIMYGWNEHQWYGGRKQGNVWHIDRPTSSKEHPTMKPVVLCGKAIKNSSKAGEIVLDVFGGSGSTLVAAQQLGRRCYMMEIDVDYVAVIIERWCQLTGTRTIKKNGVEIEWELK